MIDRPSSKPDRSGGKTAEKNNEIGDDHPLPAGAGEANLNEFQEFITQTTGRRLPIFGRELFGRSAFSPSNVAPVSPDYVVGPGDEVVIRTWGQIETNLHAVVDRNGKLQIPKVGPVAVAGVRFQELQSVIRGELSKSFRNFDLSVTMGEMQGIRIFVVGQAAHPGSHTVGSMSTLVSALFALGGPSATGSMRGIQLKRGSQTVAELDLYDMLMKGDTSHDVRLRQGDIIFIPPVGPQLAIDGSVLKPAIYELKGSLTLGDLVELSGGLSIVATEQAVAVERIVGRSARRVAQFALDASARKYPLQGGDLVRVFPVSAKIENAVTLRGNVAAPYRYAWHDNMRIGDLIPNREALIRPDYWKKINAEAYVSVQSVNSLASSLSRMGNEINWEYAAVERMNPETLAPLLIPFNLGKALAGDPQHNLALRAGDIVTIFSARDIKINYARQSRFVRLEGEFMAPGVYMVQPNETLRQLVTRVGGITPQAYLYAAEFSRDSVREQQQRQLSQYVDRLEEEMQRYTNEKIGGFSATEDTQGIQAMRSSQGAMIAKLRSVKANGRIVLEVPAVATSVSSLPDIMLEDGDRLYLPPVTSTVAVVGAVYNQNNYLYHQGKKVRDYIAQAGGPTSAADTSELYVLRADGTVISSSQKGWFSSVQGEEVRPGDDIVLPSEFVQRFVMTKELRDWSQIFYQFALGVAGLKVLNGL